MVRVVLGLESQGRPPWGWTVRAGPRCWWDFEAVTLLGVTRHADDLVEVVIESPTRIGGAGTCSTPGWVKERPRVALADLPAFGTPVTLVWVKRRWRCPNRACRGGVLDRGPCRRRTGSSGDDHRGWAVGHPRGRR
jgi:hypothetical protein